ncbi:hypothetical protein EYF80_057016 [Liparis tanakae]|uniref:Uncharacterized protein n=1 Tax=Liparis tanakae TaxID=230148 RepID=A0A4Z2EW81_9TELE|nr:hypothetical protein EYF80_057016 [Liparis tanakae]
MSAIISTSSSAASCCAFMGSMSALGRLRLATTRRPGGTLSGGRGTRDRPAGNSASSTKRPSTSRETSGGETSGGETSGGETSGGETSGGDSAPGRRGSPLVSSLCDPPADFFTCLPLCPSTAALEPAWRSLTAFLLRGDSSIVFPSSPPATFTVSPVFSSRLSFDFLVFECCRLMSFSNSFRLTIRGRLDAAASPSRVASALALAGATASALLPSLTRFLRPFVLPLSSFVLPLSSFVLPLSSFARLPSAGASVFTPRLSGGIPSTFVFRGLPGRRLGASRLLATGSRRTSGFAGKLSTLGRLGVARVFFKKPRVLTRWSSSRGVSPGLPAAAGGSFAFPTTALGLFDPAAISLSFARTLLLDKLTKQTLRLICPFARCWRAEGGVASSAQAARFLFLFFGTARSP